VSFSLRQTYTSTGNVTTGFCCADTKTAVFVSYPDPLGLSVLDAVLDSLISFDRTSANSLLHC